MKTTVNKPMQRHSQGFDKAIVAFYLLLTASSNYRWGPCCCVLGSGEPFADLALIQTPRTRGIPWSFRGGGGSTTSSTTASKHAGAFASNRDESYYQLARAIQDRVVATSASDGPGNTRNGKQPQPQQQQQLPEIPKLVKALKSLSATQKSFKLLDGAAYEAYQRTHHTTKDQNQDNNAILDVKGRAQRSAARLAATALSLGACELLELLIDPTVSNNHPQANGTLVDRQVLLNVTMTGTALGRTTVGRDKNGATEDVRLLVLYEADYEGPAGERHGTISDALSSPSSSDDRAAARRRHDVCGRLLVVIADAVEIGPALRILAEPPRVVRLGKGPEVASVQPALHDVASAILRWHLEPILRSHPNVAVHICGYSLSAGIAATAAAILQGELPLLGDKKKQRQGRSKATKAKALKRNASSGDDSNNNSNSTLTKVKEEEEPPLQGLCRCKVSAMALGGPPCFSANVAASYITSILYGDDIICRTSSDSMARFLDRTRRALQNSGFIGKRINWLTDTASLAMTNLQSHARGSEGEEARLTIPGVAYLVRPRRLGGLCSIHEVFGQHMAKNRREALRASMLWQLNDILLSRSCWRHHELESYIKGLDRVQLRGVGDDDGEDTNYDD